MSVQISVWCVNSSKSRGIPDSAIRQPHYIPQKYKCPCAKVWQNRRVFIFWLFASSLLGITLPNSSSQIQVDRGYDCCRGCCLLGREADQIQENNAEGSIQPSNSKEMIWDSQNDEGSCFSGVLSPHRILTLCPCHWTKGHHCCLNTGPFGFLLNRCPRDPNINMRLSFILCLCFSWDHLPISNDYCNVVYTGKMSTQQSKTWKYSVYSYILQRKAANHHICPSFCSRTIKWTQYDFTKNKCLHNDAHAFHSIIFGEVDEAKLPERTWDRASHKNPSIFISSVAWWLCWLWDWWLWSTYKQWNLHNNNVWAPAGSQDECLLWILMWRQDSTRWLLWIWEQRMKDRLLKSWWCNSNESYEIGWNPQMRIFWDISSSGLE